MRERRAGVERLCGGMREQEARFELREAVEQRFDAHFGRGGRQRRADRGHGKRGDDRIGVIAHHARDAVAFAQAQLGKRVGEASHARAQLAAREMHAASVGMAGGERGRIGGCDGKPEQVLGIVQLDVWKKACVLA